jgi:ABC transport system ATP-binding/permease protein
MDEYFRRLLGDGTTLVIGVADDCDLRINDPYASLHHAAITRRPNGTYWIADLGSTNGTLILRSGWLMGMKVTIPTPLLPGDIIRVGRTQIPWTPPA